MITQPLSRVTCWHYSDIVAPRLPAGCCSPRSEHRRGRSPCSMSSSAETAVTSSPRSARDRSVLLRSFRKRSHPTSGRARGRSRTDTLLKAADFPATSAFAAPGRTVRPGSWSGARLHRGLMGCRCPPSALYTFLRACEGLARHQLEQEPLRAFTEFDGFHPGDFSARAQVIRLS